MTHCEKILARLKQGPATANELYALGTVAHSRVSDLRKRGHVIEHKLVNGQHVYALLTERGNNSRQVASAPNIEGGNMASVPRPRSVSSVPRIGAVVELTATPAGDISPAAPMYSPGLSGTRSLAVPEGLQLSFGDAA